ncbi:hypothetical protein GE300_07630 [Rhodobacteraceae bacterium 2CG4]|uniref:Uncharacterized protein n=1 Tax=Halovulum marinum TaxID=2662447 RepID=A0A6L5Z0I0_9RHOB|nr:hypothetical protein [Halovulum marinum]MSU89484.1 hypothetical protein [Halovulum marinum]
MFRPALAILAFAALPALAGPAEITGVRAGKAADGWRFDVTVRHADTGWDHYADGWRVLGPDGAELGYRELLHPHEQEQPFTRSLSGVAIPEGVTEVILRAEDNVHGPGPDFPYTLPAD